LQITCLKKARIDLGFSKKNYLKFACHPRHLTKNPLATHVNRYGPSPVDS
jgi:hypothetical protein